MSMIYECPTCHAPQPAGQTACEKCGAEFDGAVPDDAILPAAAAQSQTVSSGGAASSPEAVTLPPSPAPESAPAMPYVPPPAESLPYQSPPTYRPPAYTEPPSYQSTPPQTTSRPLPKALLIALPILLLVVLGGVFIARSLDQGTAPIPPPLTTDTPQALPPTPTAPVGSPTTLSGTTTAVTSDSASVKALVGRWEAKNTDFYVFDADGTGSRGTVTGQQAPATFQWSLVQNQLILYKDKQEQLVFSPGPDDNTIFLRSESGKYLEYSRAK